MQISGIASMSDYTAIDSKNKNAENDDFTKILKDKKDSDMTAQQFLSTLTPNELYVIQKANCLANSIQVNALSKEGSENLFLNPLGKDKVVDINNDGIVEIGEGKNMIFPPPNAPESVKAAWNQATDAMSSEDKSHMMFEFLAEQLVQNSYKDADGTFHVREPGDPGWVNIFGNTTSSYIKLFEKIIYNIDNPLETPDNDHKKKDETAKNALTDIINTLKKQ
jgi:hypothetical protein